MVITRSAPWPTYLEYDLDNLVRVTWASVATDQHQDVCTPVFRARATCFATLVLILMIHAFVVRCLSDLKIFKANHQFTV